MYAAEGLQVCMYIAEGLCSRGPAVMYEAERVCNRGSAVMYVAEEGGGG